MAERLLGTLFFFVEIRELPIRCSRWRFVSLFNVAEKLHLTHVTFEFGLSRALAGIGPMILLTSLEKPIAVHTEYPFCRAKTGAGVDVIFSHAGHFQLVGANKMMPVSQIGDPDTQR